MMEPLFWWKSFWFGLFKNGCIKDCCFFEDGALYIYIYIHYMLVYIYISHCIYYMLHVSFIMLVEDLFHMIVSS